jgi:transposase
VEPTTELERQLLARIAELEGLLKGTLDANAELSANLKAAQSRITELEALLRTNSRNSSKPPSTDGLRRATPPKKATGRKVGGQPGHKGIAKDLVPEDQVDKIVDLDPEKCVHCSSPLEEAPRLDAEIRQFTELPPAKPVVTHIKLYRKRCSKCGGFSRAKLPVGSPMGGFGPGLQALVALLSSQFCLSRRDVSDLLLSVFGIRMGIASVQTCCESVSDAVASTHAKLHEALKSSPTLHADETGFGRCGDWRMWLWGARTPDIEVFRLQPGRGKEQAKDLLGEGYGGIIHRDRWRPYESMTKARSQLCWAHIRRHFQAMSEAPEATAIYGRGLMEMSNEMFHHWHLFQDGEIDRHKLALAIDQLQDRMRACLELAAQDALVVSKAQGIARDLLRQWKSLWTFVSEPGVVPTNNAAEQAVRKAVLWRKSSFGANSDAGCRYAERMLTLIGTAKLRGIRLLSWMTDAVSAQLLGNPAQDFA